MPCTLRINIPVFAAAAVITTGQAKGVRITPIGQDGYLHRFQESQAAFQSIAAVMPAVAAAVPADAEVFNQYREALFKDFRVCQA